MQKVISSVLHDPGARQGGGRVVGWPPWILEQGQWPPWISSMFWFFVWCNISRKQTRQYRKSTTTTSIIPLSDIWRSKQATSRVYHGYQPDLSQLRSALPILPSTKRPDFHLIFKRLLLKSACLRGSAPDPAGASQRPRPPAGKGWSWPPCWKIVPATALIYSSDCLYSPSIDKRLHNMQ